MNRFLRCSIWALTLSLAPKTVVAQGVSTSPSKEIVVLDPYKVIHNTGWSASFKYGLKKKIREIVLNVPSGTVAAKAGLKTGDRLTAIAGHRVIGLTTQEYEAVDRDARRKNNHGRIAVTYTVLRNGKSLEFTLVLQPGYMPEQSPEPAKRAPR